MSLPFEDKDLSSLLSSYNDLSVIYSQYNVQGSKKKLYGDKNYVL